MIINNQKEQTNLKTSVTYKGNGTQKQFDFPFDYLRKAFVKVSVNNAIVDGYTIDNRSVIFNIAPASNDVIVIYRETTTDRLVSWADASVLKAADMTISQVQQLHIIEESKEWSIVNSMVLNGDNEWEGRNHKIVNVLDPTAPQDVVTKHYMETVQDGFVQENTELKNEATKQATKATTEANRAKTEANRAKTEADRAKTAADSVGNPVVSITQSDGNLTVTKGDGSSDTLTVTPAKASQAEAEAGTDDIKMMTPARVKEAIEAFDNTPVGDVVFRPFLKAGYVKANGATVNRADYPRLVAFANANNLWTDSPSTEPWKYGRGNGSTTMVLPNYVGRFIQGGDTPQVLQAGLPNVELYIGRVEYYTPNPPNMIMSEIQNNRTFTEADFASDSLAYVAMSLQRGNPIYGNSTTVQPPSITLIPQLRY